MSFFIQSLRLQFVRFVLVGIVNTGFSYLVYAIFLFLGFHYALANLISLILGMLFSFHTQGRFVFENTDIRLLGRFIVGWGMIYFVTIIIIGRFIAMGLDAYISGALALPFSTLMSYFVQKYFVFRANLKNAGYIRPETLE